jgi:hypothetical protein
VESLPRRVEAAISINGGPTPNQCPWFWNEMFEEQVSTYFWSCNVLWGSCTLATSVEGYTIMLAVPSSTDDVWGSDSFLQLFRYSPRCEKEQYTLLKQIIGKRDCFTLHQPKLSCKLVVECAHPVDVVYWSLYFSHSPSNHEQLVILQFAGAMSRMAKKTNKTTMANPSSGSRSCSYSISLKDTH